MPKIFVVSLFISDSCFYAIQGITVSVYMTCDACSSRERGSCYINKPYKNVNNCGAVYQFIFRGKQNCLLANTETFTFLGNLDILGKGRKVFI